MNNPQKNVHDLNQAVLITALSKLASNLQSCQSRLDYACARATRAQNAHIQDKLSEASLKLSEMLEILDDEAIQALLKTYPERDLLQELMTNLNPLTPTHEEINF
ncbi:MULTISPECIES: hypothetical protein [Cyanophyceae]|uniref:hypothetical protein n=1 Tax=Cyanophyceae TaxID=3028117 RepID=UPI00016DCF1E|nr:MULTISPECIES: hypothetical protein [Cyanophyceae]ACB01016.1 hypothetical protein SYNPCC7002_F0085 [Picosynechococcus sp. PCC 7002]SMH58366.1 hypothetical protein SAMN06272755_3147 [Picosynechococcus sp. OG1]SMQ86397.1 hypothetical protein SAMN06272774_3138 [Synechococcus sp. 7002]